MKFKHCDGVWIAPSCPSVAHDNAIELHFVCIVAM